MSARWHAAGMHPLEMNIEQAMRLEDWRISFAAAGGTHVEAEAARSRALDKAHRSTLPNDVVFWREMGLELEAMLLTGRVRARHQPPGDR
jgi:hypothetical protein